MYKDREAISLPHVQVRQALIRMAHNATNNHYFHIVYHDVCLCNTVTAVSLLQGMVCLHWGACLSAQECKQ